MLSQQDIWHALDQLADKFSMSPSSMARQAGLDPTTFNKSKRHSGNGKPRWLSTESLAKVLNMLGVDFEEFAALASTRQKHGFENKSNTSVPLIGLAQAGDAGFFDGSGFPVGEGWDDIDVPGRLDENVYALQISGDSMAPALRHGDKVIVAPSEDLQRGDRVVVKTRGGEVMAKELKKITPNGVELISVNPEFPDRALKTVDIQWIARIVWVTQ